MHTDLQLGSLGCTEYVSMGTFSMATSESSRDFLCFRLQRLRTSSETVSRAAQTGDTMPSQPTQTVNDTALRAYQTDTLAIKALVPREARSPGL